MFWFFAVFSGIVLPAKPKTLNSCACFGLVSTWKRRVRYVETVDDAADSFRWGGGAAAGVSRENGLNRTLYPESERRRLNAALLIGDGRFHVETARIKIFSQALRAFPRGNAISDDYALY
jgi:hypothetical protein